MRNYGEGLMKVRTLPVYSKLAEQIPPEIVLPQGWRGLSEHQVQTYQALVSGEYDVIFNTAMTGDGKSLAGQLPTLVDFGDNPLFAMYPTNELIRDQAKQLDQSKALWGSELYQHILDSSELDRLMEGRDFLQRGDALTSLARNNDVVLTNPDIFHYIMEAFYRNKQDAPDKVIRPLVDKFRQFTFDEFHVFETPQVISVVNAMLFIKIITGVHAPQFLFLSATPDEQMVGFLDRAGLNYREINPALQGWYAHSAIQPDSKKWRRILHGSDIAFDSGHIEEWIEAHVDDILLAFFEKHRPNAKGAIIVNSVASAMRLTKFLKPIFAKHNLTVMPNTGLTAQAQRTKSYEADLLIGTSTVDIGVDFNINFLIFESRDAGTFLQRLGRLGRHDGYSRDGATHTFNTFQAYALVPPWIAETLFIGRDGQPPLLTDDTEMTREKLTEAIIEAYPQPATFFGYAQDWGKFQSLKVITELNNFTVRAQYSQTRDQLGNQYQRTFQINLRQAAGERKTLKENKALLLVDEALAFRGGSYFQAAILDESEPDLHEPKLYDLLSLLANGILTPLDEATFYQAVDQADLPRKRFEQANGPKLDPIGFFRLQGWQTERTNFSLHFNEDIGGWGSDRFGVALVLRHWKIDATGMSAVNRKLSRRSVPATLCLAADHPLELKRLLYLPMLFPLYSFMSRDGLKGCVAFGREALLLHTKLKRHRLDSGGGAMFA